MSWSVTSGHAERISLCLFESERSTVEADRVELERGPGGLWRMPEEVLREGQIYGLRCEGPWDPAAGHRFDPAKLLVDPRARQIIGPTRWHRDLSERGVDSAAVAPRCVWRDPEDRGVSRLASRRSWEETILYELHVAGFTRRHPDVPEHERGTYLGLTHPSVLDHLTSMGVTAVQLMPVQQSFTERHLVERGLTNYWGYGPLAWFAPHAAYAATGDPVAEFREMVRRFREAGLEVILDVVFNHTAEGPVEGGPTLSFRGIDNALYYRRDLGRPVDTTGCGNTLDFGRHEVIDLTVECLVYWVREMGVDGFRFDLAVTLGRGVDGEFSPDAPFFRALSSAGLDGVRWIAEPWDVGGYELGEFPVGWAEWNDQFRDRVRRHWLSGEPSADALRELLTVSGHRVDGRSSRDVCYVTCHDGLTLEDVVSYDAKRNQPNGEGNRDGQHGELSHAFGVEGPTDDPRVRQARLRAKKGMLATVLLSDGVPMLSHGDELDRTQLGNNNAYCQDNEISWTDWSRSRELSRLIRLLTRYRARHRSATVEACAAADRPSSPSPEPASGRS